MEKVNILVGRFQPFTLGHLKCALQAKDELGVDTVLCMIDTKRPDARHPFTSDDLIKMYSRLVDTTCIKDIVLVKNANIVDISKALEEKDYQIQSWTCGTDRVSSYTLMANRYRNDANLPIDFQIIEIKRGNQDISATAVRNALYADDKRKFKALVPMQLYRYYDELKKIIDKIK